MLHFGHVAVTVLVATGILVIAATWFDLGRRLKALLLAILEIKNISKSLAELQKSHTEIAEKLRKVDVNFDRINGAVSKLSTGTGGPRQLNSSATRAEPDWTRWHPYATQAPFVRAYEEFFDKEPSKDTVDKRIRFYAMSGVLASLPDDILAGADVAECGCYLGHSSFIIASVLRARGFEGRFHIFDSFEGLSDAAPEDLTPLTGSQDEDEIARQLGPKNGKRRFHGGLEQVQANLAEFNFIDYRKGWIPERFGDVADRSFAFVNIDVDLYQPSLDSFEFLFPRLRMGGAMFIDDYGLMSWPGSIRAIDACLERHKITGRFDVPAGGLIIVK